MVPLRQGLIFKIVSIRVKGGRAGKSREAIASKVSDIFCLFELRRGWIGPKHELSLEICYLEITFMLLQRLTKVLQVLPASNVYIIKLSQNLAGVTCCSVAVMWMQFSNCHYKRIA